ncbi:hypothetical protein EWB00_003501 [Schistosoma japonicum]|uniref:Uncharacterized protein n=1 Tax=Schistosoma japonicum TaxID=6182 RepID=A0A4Z2D8L1_SCHJA|nr:hypothetical protein EWB00_003501 [Schistosoma japonicum]
MEVLDLDDYLVQDGHVDQVEINEVDDSEFDYDNTVINYDSFPSPDSVDIARPQINQINGKCIINTMKNTYA